MKLRELKEILNTIGDDELELWIHPFGTPSCELDSVGIGKVCSNDINENGREALLFHILGDIF